MMKIVISFWITLYCSLMATSVHASHGGGFWGWLEHFWGHGGGGGGNAVPELNGAMGPIALALLAGIIGIAVERKRRKSK